jgi:hypothetical protein
LICCGDISEFYIYAQISPDYSGYFWRFIKILRIFIQKACIFMHYELEYTKRDIVLERFCYEKGIY